ncbi:hypothetical protein KSP39_PZI011292 [Platanthera zijinensis]|uniref:SMP-30/Gluconolactonase/LRE-like region domain-containing protein n=1 Tax=Platanthera zijinensis TaxID=2320716 RepID=A0AAP0BHM3_9ASPA
MARYWCGLCGLRAAILLALATAIPLALIASLERAATAAGGTIGFRSGSWFGECAKWDPPRRRFLISTFLEGQIAEIRLPGIADGSELEARTVIADDDVAGNASLGIAIDAARGRFLVVYADVRRFRSAAVASYGLDSGERFFLTRLSCPDDEPSFADDVAVDDDGNAYVTDAKSNKIWKVGLNGELQSIIRSDLFSQNKEWYRSFVGLNGIVHHRNGYLLAVHTAAGQLFKVDTKTEEVRVVRVAGSVLMGDGMELLSPTKLVVAGAFPCARIVESFDDWETAAVTARYVGPLHRVATAATAVEGKVYVNYLLDLGILRRRHVLTEAVFSRGFAAK